MESSFPLRVRTQLIAILPPNEVTVPEAQSVVPGIRAYSARSVKFSKTARSWANSCVVGPNSGSHIEHEGRLYVPLWIHGEARLASAIGLRSRRTNCSGPPGLKIPRDSRQPAGWVLFFGLLVHLDKELRHDQFHGFVRLPRWNPRFLRS
jgi:hypothetical protein